MTERPFCIDLKQPQLELLLQPRVLDRQHLHLWHVDVKADAELPGGHHHPSYITRLHSSPNDQHGHFKITDHSTTFKRTIQF